MKLLIKPIDYFILLAFSILINCSSDGPSANLPEEVATPLVSVSAESLSFNDTEILMFSDSKTLTFSGVDLSENLAINIGVNFEISLDDENYETQIIIQPSNSDVSAQTLFVRFAPGEDTIGQSQGTLTLSSTGAISKTVNLIANALGTSPYLSINYAEFSFTETSIGTITESIPIEVSANNLSTSLTISTESPFMISLNDTEFSSTIQLDEQTANEDFILYVRFQPTEIGESLSSVEFNSDGLSTVSLALSGIGIAMVYNYQTFDQTRLAYGGGFSQSSSQTFTLHEDMTTIETINMYLQLNCPSGGCNAWDVYSNILVKDPFSNEWYEIGRYITPYGVGTGQLERGLEIDVTDFKSLLTGTIELKAFIEVWGSDGWELSVDFDYVQGTPDYQYYEIAPIVQYNNNSLGGVIYGEDDSAFDLTKTIFIPSNSESMHLRTIITGWGHATPNDQDGRPCAEWCYRTHNVKINNNQEFQHYLGPIGCITNPVSPQYGNWSPDRAGWCPGMAVPNRINSLEASLAGTTFSFDYEFEPWTNDLLSTSSNIHAYYAISSFIIVKSNSPINKPTVTE